MTPPVVTDTSAANPQPTPTSSGLGNLGAALPRWIANATTTITLLVTAVGGISAAISLKTQLDQQTTKTSTATRKTEEVVSNGLVSPTSNRELDEWTRHAADQPGDMEVKNETLKAGDGSVRITHYLHDGCINILRYRPGKEDPESKWIFGTPDPPRQVRSTPPPVTLQNDSGITLVSSPSRNPQPHLQNAIFSGSQPTALRTAAPPGKCLNPHPGAYTPRNQKIDNCNVIQTRTYADGCMNTQHFNSCTGSWEVTPSGSPKITWTHCVH